MRATKEMMKSGEALVGMKRRGSQLFIRLFIISISDLKQRQREWELGKIELTSLDRTWCVVEMTRCVKVNEAWRRDGPLDKEWQSKQ